MRQYTSVTQFFSISESGIIVNSGEEGVPIKFTQKPAPVGLQQPRVTPSLVLTRDLSVLVEALRNLQVASASCVWESRRSSRQSSVFFCPVPLVETTLSTEAWTSALCGVPGRLPGLVTELGLPQREGISRTLGALRDPAVPWEGTSIPTCGDPSFIWTLNAVKSTSLCLQDPCRKCPSLPIQPLRAQAWSHLESG